MGTELAAASLGHARDDDVRRWRWPWIGGGKPEKEMSPGKPEKEMSPGKPEKEMSPGKPELRAIPGI